MEFEYNPPNPLLEKPIDEEPLLYSQQWLDNDMWSDHYAWPGTDDEQKEWLHKEPLKPLELLKPKDIGEKDIQLKQKAYDFWIDRLICKLNPLRTTTVIYDIPYKRITDYTFIFEKMLSDLGQINKYKIYCKTNKILMSHSIKIKPTNKHYKQKVLNGIYRKLFIASRLWNMGTTQPIIVKRTSDRGIAEWYKNIIDSTFVDHIIGITKIMINNATAQYQVVINVNIN